MRIGFDAKRAYHNTSGLGNYSRDLLRILSQNWENDSFFLFNPKPSLKKFGVNSNNVTQITPERRWKKWSSLWRIHGIAKVAKELQLDVYHGLSNELPANISKKIKTIVTIHDLIFERFPEWYSTVDRKIYRKKFKSAAQVANVVVTISEQSKTDLISFYNIEEEKIKVVYQSCHKAFQNSISKNTLDAVAEKYNLPKKYLLYVGTIEKRKNLLTVFEAIENEPEIEIVVVGKKTKYAKTVFDFVENSNLKNRVHYLSGINMDELAAVYRAAHTFVYPSQFEGFGIPIIEALFSRVPVITSTGSCFSEAGGPHSIYLPYNGVDQWNKNIIELWNDDAKCHEIAEKGWEYAQQFTDENILSKWEEIYAQFRN